MVRLVYSYNPEVSVISNPAGEFQLRSNFNNGCCLHASTVDGKLQATLIVSGPAVRKILASPVELKLQAAMIRKVTILAGGKPADQVQVVAKGTSFCCEGVTGSNGQVELRFPAGKFPQALIAWHPQLGGAGKFNYPDGLKEGPLTLSLHTPDRASRHTIRVIDHRGLGVADLDLAAAISVGETGWFSSKGFPAARLRTDNQGIVLVPWIPRANLNSVGVDLDSPDWKIDDVDDNTTSRGLTTIHVRRTSTVLGRLIMPEGVSAEGILVVADGFGTKSTGAVEQTRARRDGWFTLRVPPDHGFAVAIDDLEWASHHWTGKILEVDGQAPARITIRPYPATPLTIRVTQGTDRKPVDNAWVHSSRREDFRWNDDTGAQRLAGGGVRDWFKTDSKGEVQTGVGRGKYNFRLTTGKWAEEKDIQVSSDKPVVLEFHR